MGKKHRKSKAAPRAADQLPVVTPTSNSLPPIQALWYESNRLWGGASIFSAITLTVVASMNKDLRWMLLLAWPFAAFTIWTATALLHHKGHRIRLAIVGTALVGAGLYGLYLWLRPNQQQSGFMQFTEMKPVYPLFTLGKPLMLNVYYQNKSTFPVVGVKQDAALGFIYGPSAQAKSGYVRQTFARQMLNDLKATSSYGDVGVGGTIWTTVQSDHDLTTNDVNSLIEGKVTLYVISHIEWTEHPKGFNLCLYMDRPPGPRVEDFSQLSWHVCEQ